MIKLNIFLHLQWVISFVVMDNSPSWGPLSRIDELDLMGCL